MNVLIVSFWFPPSNVVGAIRVGKLARYLDRRGYGLRVLTTDIGGDRSLPLEIAREQVTCTDYRQGKERLPLMVWVFPPGAAAARAPVWFGCSAAGQPSSVQWMNCLVLRAIPQGRGYGIACGTTTMG